MALARLTNPKDPVDEIFVEFDAVLSEKNAGSVDATSNPVERIEGAKNSITDHISVNPNQINIDAILSNYNQILDSYQLDEDIPSIVDDKLKILERWKNDGDILIYEGHNRTENDVIILDLDDTFSINGGDSVTLKITLLKIRIAQALTQELNAPVDIRKTQKLGKQDKKEKSVPGETEAESEERRRSFGVTGRF